ncbi:MAG: thioesterase family protein [Nocardioidaceae bacterium]
MTSEGVLAETEFDRGIAATRRADQPTTYDVELGSGWQIGAGINGGMLLATVGNALRASLEGDGHPDPLTISAYYLSASRPGPAFVRTDVLRSGRSLSTATASLVQIEGGQETERLRALATYGDLAALPDVVHTTATPPDLPPPDQCISTHEAPPTFMKNADLLDRLDLRLDPACAGWALGEPSGRGLIQGWLRMADDREPDPLLMLLAVDALPPVTFDLGLFGWTPTLELTVHLRAKPAPGWLRVTHSTRNFAGGMLEEDAEVWDASGRLVAQSRQLARAPKPR